MAIGNIGEIILQVAILFLALTVHESAHAWSANRLGDPTARLLGRINLNPLVHIDLFGTVLFPAILLITGMPVFGWAKPVPVNLLNLRNPRRDHAWISAAGPLSNIGLALIAIIGYRAIVLLASPVEKDSLTDDTLWVLAWCALINLILAAFNLIPIPPLDGGGILTGILPDRALPALEAIRPYGFMILLLLLITPILDGYIGLVMRLAILLLGGY